MHYPICITWPVGNEPCKISAPDFKIEVSGTDFQSTHDNLIKELKRHLKRMAFNEEPIPQPSALESTLSCACACRGVVAVDIDPYMGKTEKINVTLPSNLILEIDNHVKDNGFKSRSAFLAAAAREKLVK